MIRPFRRFRSLLLWALFCLAGVSAVPARADGPALTAVFGIAGRYRPGAWCPVTVTVQNPTGDGITGQVQVLAGADSNQGRGGSSPTLGAALYARPVTVTAGAGPQTFQLYSRDLDPGRDSVTVQLVEGRARGDGRVLAQANTQDTKTSPAITGTPVSDSDLLLVGFGGDPGAFTPLNGRQLGLAHQVGGFTVGNVSAGATGNQLATVQVAEAGAVNLPDKAAGYAGVDAFLLRSDAPLDALTEAQADALRGWVAGGGHLIVCGGVDPSRFAAAFYSGLLPVSVGAARPALSLPGAGPVGALMLTPKSLPGVRVLRSAPDGSPLVVAGPYGAGCVTMTAYDPTAKSFQSPTFDSGVLWRTLLTDGPGASAAVLPHIAAREENYQSGPYYGSPSPLLSDAVMRGPSLDAPGTEVIGLFLLVYLIALVPANYLILKRLDRKELAWVTIPLLVLLFAVGTFGVGYAAKGGTVFVNRTAIVETTAGRHEAGVYAELGLFSPHRTSYDLTLPGANALAAIPNPGFSYGYRGGSGADTQSYGLTRFVQTPEGVSLLDTSVNMWAMRAFDVQATEDLGGTVDSTLTEQSNPPPTGLEVSPASGTVTNHLSHVLTGCVLLHGGQWQTLGDLQPGASVPISGVPTGANGRAGSLSGLPMGGQAGASDAQGDIRARMQAALADYARSLGQQNPNNNYNSGPGQAPDVYAPSSGEALLLGWSADPALAGPAPRVDGHTVHENDVTLVIVHLPIRGARIAAAAPRLTSLPNTFSPIPRFNIVSRNAPAYRQALIPGSPGLAALPPGRSVCVRGIVRMTTPDPNGPLITLGPASGQPPSGRTLSVSLRGPILSRMPYLFTLQGREVLNNGPISGHQSLPLTQGRELLITGPVSSNQGLPQIVLTRPSQIQLVK